MEATCGLWHKHPFHPMPENPANGDGLIHSAMALSNDDAFIGLNALLIALADAHAHSDGVTDVNVGRSFFS